MSDAAHEIFLLDHETSGERLNRNGVFDFTCEADTIRAAALDAVAAAIPQFPQHSAEIGFQMKRLKTTTALAHLAKRSINTLGEPDQVQYADVIDGICDSAAFLGFRLGEARWAIERHVESSRRVLDMSDQHFRFGLRAYERGQHTDAKEQFGLALKEDPTNYFTYQYLGVIERSQGRLRAALPHFEKARAYATTSRLCAIAQLHLANTHWALDDGDAACTASADAYSSDPEMARAWFEHSCYTAAADQREKALPALQTAVALEPRYWVGADTSGFFNGIRDDVLSLQDRIKHDWERKARERIAERFARTTESVATSDVPEIDKEIERTNGLLDLLHGNNLYCFMEIAEMA